jgi:hypothetical protein
MSQESSLHSALKDWYTRPGDRQEALIDGYLVDVATDDLLIEIQTRQFGALRKKLGDLLMNYPVRLVHPIAAEKWIVRLPNTPDGAPQRRKSPRRGSLLELFKELVCLPGLLAHPNLSLEVLLVRVDEVRRDDGRGSWRRRGVSIVDRRLIEVLDRRLFTQPSDLAALLPAGLAAPFTNAELARQARISPRLAGQMTYCLKNLSVVQPVGKRGKAVLYTYNETPAPDAGHHEETYG